MNFSCGGCVAEVGRSWIMCLVLKILEEGGACPQSLQCLKII